MNHRWTTVCIVHYDSAGWGGYREGAATLVMIVPFWLAFIAARRGIDNLTAVAHKLYTQQDEFFSARNEGTIVRGRDEDQTTPVRNPYELLADSDKGLNMGMCLCREKNPNNRDIDSRNAPSSSPNVAATSFREFYSQGRQWRLGVGEGRREQFTVHTSRSHNHNGRSLATTVHMKKHGGQAGKSIDSLVLETLSLIRTLVDK